MIAVDASTTMRISHSGEPVFMVMKPNEDSIKCFFMDAPCLRGFVAISSTVNVLENDLIQRLRFDRQILKKSVEKCSWGNGFYSTSD
jgi:hypothetical protein